MTMEVVLRHVEGITVRALEVNGRVRIIKSSKEQLRPLLKRLHIDVDAIATSEQLKHAIERIECSGFLDKVIGR